MNSFREWLSDNLRYLLLLLIVILGVGAIILGVRLYRKLPSGSGPEGTGAE